VCFFPLTIIHALGSLCLFKIIQFTFSRDGKFSFLNEKGTTVIKRELHINIPWDLFDERSMGNGPFQNYLKIHLDSEKLNEKFIQKWIYFS
jgi:hypothetical protein